MTIHSLYSILIDDRYVCNVLICTMYTLCDILGLFTEIPIHELTRLKWMTKTSQNSLTFSLIIKINSDKTPWKALKGFLLGLNQTYIQVLYTIKLKKLLVNFFLQRLKKMFSTQFLRKVVFRYFEYHDSDISAWY